MGRYYTCLPVCMHACMPCMHACVCKRFSMRLGPDAIACNATINACLERWELALSLLAGTCSQERGDQDHIKDKKASKMLRMFPLTLQCESATCCKPSGCLFQR